MVWQKQKIGFAATILLEGTECTESVNVANIKKIQLFIGGGF